MGREWHWTRSIVRREKESPGCMSGMIHFFDFHHLLFTASSGRTQPGFSPQTHHILPDQLKGVEAPRNSLELDETATAVSSSATGEGGYFDVPVGIQLVQATPLVKKNKIELEVLLEEEKRSSQAATPRTPNVVARLMGLEILPDASSTPRTPNVESSEEHKRNIINKKNKIRKKKQSNDESRKESVPPRQPLQSRNCNILPQARSETGSRSLPDTPRASSARSWDVDPRLSLQLNKENINSRDMHELKYLYEMSGDHHSLPTSPPLYSNKSRKKDFLEENRSPRSHYYARQIVKQVKESISSRRGSSATSPGEEQVIKSRRTRPAMKCCQSKPSEVLPLLPPPSSSSPQNRPLEDNIPILHPLPPKPPCLPAPPPCLPSSSGAFFKRRDTIEAKAIKMGSSKSKNSSYDRFTERIKRQLPPSETACRPLPSSSTSSPSNLESQYPKILLSFDKVKHGSIPTFTTVNRKEASHGQVPVSRSEVIHPTSTIPTQQQEVLKPLSSIKYEAKELDPEFSYVRSILERGGIIGTTVVRWFSPSLPIDPIVFHQLELELELELPDQFQPERDDSKGPLRLRSNRKLLFHLVEEILGDILGLPIPSAKAAEKRLHGMDKEQLLRRLCSQIRSFPLADCRVVGDIDALVAEDLPEGKVRRLLRHPSVVAEAEDMALEIERDVLDSLLGEAAASLALCSKG